MSSSIFPRAFKAAEFLSTYISVILFWIDSELGEELIEVGFPVHKSNGFYYGDTLYVKLTETKTDSDVVKVILHELGHHLYRKGLLKEEEIDLGYSFNVNMAWLFSYPPEEQEEERIVESFALWGMDSNTGSLNPSFWSCLRSKLKQL